MEIPATALEAARTAFAAAKSSDDPLARALEAAIDAILDPVKFDRNKRWTNIEAMMIFNEKVRPKTFTLYNDGMQFTAGSNSGYNLFMLMSFMIGQTMQDLYTTAISMGCQAQFPTEKEFITWYCDEMLKQHDERDRRQSIIDAMKPRED